jgi:putative hemolysin
MDADPAGNSILFNLLLLLFFTLLNAFFAGAEMAVVSVNKNRIRSMADEGNKKAKVIEGLFDDSGCDHICGILFVGIGSVGDFACSGAVT